MNKEMSKNNEIMPQKYPTHNPKWRNNFNVSIMNNNGARYNHNGPRGLMFGLMDQI